MNLSQKRGLIIAVLAATVFGLYPPFTKLAFNDGASSSFVSLINILMRAVVFNSLCIMRGLNPLPKQHELGSTFIAGFYQALNVICLIAALKYLPGPVVVTIFFSSTIFFLFFLAFKKEIELSLSIFAITVLATLGISFVVNLWSTEATLSATGLFLSVGAAITRLGRLYTFGQQVKVLDPLVVGGRVFAAGLLLALPLIFLMPLQAPLTNYGILFTLLCCISVTIGSLGTFQALKLLGSFKYTLTSKLEPIFTCLFSFLILGETLVPIQYLGIFLVLGCLSWYQFYDAKVKAAELKAATE